MLLSGQNGQNGTGVGFLGMADEEGTQMLIFRLADEIYGIEASTVQEIIIVYEITRVPRAPALIEGVINLRGSIVPILDLRKRFDLPEVAFGSKTRMVIVETSAGLVGLIVDEVIEVMPIPPALINRSPTFLSGPVDPESLLGVAKLDKKLVVLLNVEKVLKIPR